MDKSTKKYTIVTDDKIQPCCAYMEDFYNRRDSKSFSQ
jgi:hypothetical protein